MNSILEILAGQLGQQAIGKIAARLGVDEQTARKAVSIALPMIMAALARNAASKDGAHSLYNALESDHDGSLLGAIGDFVEQGNTGDGESILEHVFGSRLPRVEKTVARSTGLDSQAISKLFALLAPMVMAQLGQSRKQQELDPDGVADLLRQESARIELDTEHAGTDASPTSVSPLGELAKQLLDSDGDGDMTDDALRIGGGFLAELLRGK